MYVNSVRGTRRNDINRTPHEGMTTEHNTVEYPVYRPYIHNNLDGIV